MFSCDSLDTRDTVGCLRVLSDDEHLLVSGAGNPWAAVVGGLQGSVAGGIAGAVTGPMLGTPWAASGLAGMASGLIHGAFSGWFKVP
ncbi:ABC transporter permease [Burkholderia sp. 4701]|nr:ABC transporter permease [Burkholderia sp. 4701]MXN80633.1 ABC transporter permease [Burkholderia sp. 4812]